MKVKTLSRFGSLAVIALSFVLLMLFQTLGRTQVADTLSPTRTEYLLALEAYNNGAYETAHARFLKLAQQGNVDAKSMLGVMYFHGHGVRQDKVKVAIWFYQAARAGRPAAQLVLGKLYLAGDGVVADREQAGFWLSLAYDRGNQDVAGQAKVALDQVMPLLSEPLRKEILKRVALWRPIMPDHETLGSS